LCPKSAQHLFSCDGTDENERTPAVHWQALEERLSEACVPDTQREHARADLRRADPILARLIDAHPGLNPRAWLADLPPMDAFGVLVFQVIGQQLSVRATRHILERLMELFGGTLPTPDALLAIAPEKLVKAGLSRRKVATLREVAKRFAPWPVARRRTSAPV
jgi:3-methyladenine DNA glycosylase/8-oxoguanine DNA glycosylase